MSSLFSLNACPTRNFELFCRVENSNYKLYLQNKGSEPQTVGDLTVFTAKNPFPPSTPVYGEGYNMLSQYSGTVEKCELFASFSDYDHYKLPKPEGKNQVYNIAVFYPEDSEPLLVGFASCRRFNGWIRFNKDVIELAVNGENATVMPGEEIELEDVYIEQGEINKITHNFGGAIAKNHPRLEFEEIPTGWCSWLAYGPEVTAENIYDNLDAIKKHNLNLKYIQIDDGYQSKWGDWFDFTDKFEGGVKRVCLDIKEKGFEPAIWVAPFVAEKTSRLFRDHPDWFVKDDTGLPLSSDTVTFGGWRCAPWYILDMTHPCAQDYLKKVFSTMRNEWQVKYFKLDAIVWAALPFGHRYDDTKTSVEAFRMGMDAILESAGSDSFILGCNAPMWPSIGKVHGMRITNDNVRAWDRFTQLARECFSRNWQHNRLWINDPDTVLLQNRTVTVMGPDGEETQRLENVPDNEFAFNAAYTMASGGMVLSSDDITALTDENVSLLKKLLPPTNVSAEFDSRAYTVGRAKIDEKTTLIYVFNFDDYDKDIEVETGDFSSAFDLFNNQIIDTCQGKIKFEAFPKRYATVLVCKK